MTSHSTNKLKILNDPIYGFITIPNALIFDLIEHPYFQRLRRIAQMGLSYLVYPGAHHTRFHHALGCMHLMQKAVQVLRFKGIQISPEEEEGVLIAILLHDIGHGAFSHALEQSIVKGIHHEELSLKFMEALNVEFDGKLALAITIFKGEYSRKFLLQLVSSQLDMDRMDYLKRDSFYTGVAEGNINSDRLITMLNVKDDALLIEEKGIYSIEKFILARRLMYWQVYLHKTGLVAENVLKKVLKRAKELTLKGIYVPANATFSFFLKTTVGTHNFNDEILNLFSKLDDYDVLSAIKEWSDHEDTTLAYLATAIINRKLPKIIIQKNPFSKEEIAEIRADFLVNNPALSSEIDYYIFHGKVQNQAYNEKKDPIEVLFKNGDVLDVVRASDHLNIQALSKPVVKYFLCVPKK
ncbi:MAG: phosphohydrolase [Flavobacteriaceae bacterium]|nr:MAG: phosphohydrolase [Flavobacteriaceae bacterium]